VTCDRGGKTMVSVRFFLYGYQGAAVAETAKGAWQDWLAERFG